MSDGLQKQYDEIQKQIPPAERKIRKRLGEAMLRFVKWVMAVPPKETLEPGARA